MSLAKKVLIGIAGLTISLILVKVFWNLLKKVPGVGGAAEHVDNLMSEGQF